MATGVANVVILTTSLVGAFAEAVVAFRWYEPPTRDGETPDPVLESVLFFVAFAVCFAVIGLVISVLGRTAPPFGVVATLLVALLGVGMVYVSYTGRIGSTTDPDQQYMSTVFGAVLAVYPVLFLAV